MCQAETAEGPSIRYAMDRHRVLIGNFQSQIIQREIRLGCHPCRDPAPQSAQLTMTAAIALSSRLQSARLALQHHYVVDELQRNPEPSGGSAVRITVLHKRDNLFTKCRRMWLAHLIPPISALQTGNHRPSLMGILNRKGRNTLWLFHVAGS